jgi:hypothetical protein
VSPPRVRPSLVGTWRAVWGTGQVNRLLTFEADGTFRAVGPDAFRRRPEGQTGRSIGTWKLEGDTLTIKERAVAGVHAARQSTNLQSEDQ